MITKFEKRVLAFMLAGLLCVPVTAVPSVTANAEEVESTVQQDDQQTGEADAQTSTSETQQPASGNQEDESSGGETGNDLSDGAFVPIEEEQDETQQNGEQEVNENKETQTENRQEEEEQKKAAAQKTAANNLSDEELEEVTLGENGEPVRMTTEIAESENVVRYVFRPEEDGAYYVDLLSMGGFQIYEKWDDDYEYPIDGGMSSEDRYDSATVELTAGSTYYIDISYDYSGTAGTVKWKLGRPESVGPGTYEAVISEPGERVHYQLIYEEADIYYFTTDWSADAYLEIASMSHTMLTSSPTYEMISKDDNCYIDAYYAYNIDATGTFNWTVEAVYPQTVSQGETIHTVIGDEIGHQYYEFVPQADGRYGVKGKDALIYDAYLSYRGEIAELTAGETYYIRLNDIATNTEFDWSIDLAQEVVVQENEVIHTDAGAIDYYKFVPDEDGTYALTGNIYATLYDDEWYDIGYGDTWEMTGGDTYYLVIDNSSEAEWSIKRPQMIDVQDGEAIHTEVGSVDNYRFVPTESGRYHLSSYSAQLYDAEWNSMYGQYHQLSAGTTYYIKVSSFSDVDWSISKQEEIEITAGQFYRISAGQNIYFKFVPEESCEYSISNRLNVYDSEWNVIYNDNLVEGETYYLTPYSTSLSFYFSIEKREAVETKEIEIQSGEAYTTPSDQQIIYTFVPKKSGRYHFRTEETAYIDVSNGTDENSGYIDYWISLEAGVEYEIGIRNRSDEPAVHWSVQNVELISIEEGEEIVTEASISQEYEFVPQTSGYYLLASDDQGRCTVYDNEWNRIYVSSDTTDMYDYIDENGFGVNIYMEEGQTYYFDILPGGDTAAWQINPIEESGDYRYRVLPNGTVEILNYLGNATSVDIPESIDGKAVGSIGYGAFSENKQIESVTIPGTVTGLQYGAFLSCSSLRNVTLAEGSTLQSIGNMAFRYCTSLTDINLPDSVEKIESQAFYNCSRLGEVNLGSKLNEIGNQAFYGSGLTDVLIPDSVAVLGDWTFGSCEELREVTLGSGIDGISSYAFSGCEKLTAIEFPENITYIGNGAFNSTGVCKVDIPDTVTSVGNSAFSYCSKLQEVNIGSNVTYIADGAFSGCDLRQLTINGEVESIGDSAFLNNKNLESIEIPSSVTRIEYRAFSGCSSLLEIEIPDSVEAIAGFAFDSANNNVNTAWYDNQDDGVVYAGKVLYKYKGEAPEGTTITVEDGTKGIAGYAFCWQYNLKEIQLPNTVTNIGDYAFYGCELMTEIHIPQSVTEIGECALGYLDNYDGIKVPGFTIYGVAGSAAQTYAEENGFDFVEVEPDYTLGDVDASGNVDISDLRMVLRSVCGKVTLTEEQKLAADVEKDSVVNIQDLRKILRYVCHKIDSFE